MKELMESIIIEMFRRVGLNYNMEQILEYAKQDEWYTLKSWTEEEEESFFGWMNVELKKKRWNAKVRQREIGMFKLMWGWKRNDSACRVCGQVGFHKMDCGRKVTTNETK